MKNSLTSILLFFCLFSFSIANAQKAYAVSVNSKHENTKMTVEEFKNATFGIYSFANPTETYILKGFTVKYPGQPVMENKGNKLNASALGGLERVTIGDQVIVSIEKKISPKGVVLDESISILVTIIK